MTAGESLALQNELVSPRPSQVTERMKVSASLQCFIAALILTLAQIGIAVCVVAPPAWPLSDRYASLIQHDGYWFANIVDRGYGTTVPPIDHKVMEVSNVAFFPAYPRLARARSVRSFICNTSRALLLTAQTRGLGFLELFLSLLRTLEPIADCFSFFGALRSSLIRRRFYLIAGYSESLFLMSLVGFIYWSSAEGRAASFWPRSMASSCRPRASSGFRARLFRSCARFSKMAGTDCARRARWIQRYGPAVALIVCSDARCRGFFRLLPAALGSVGYVYAHAGSRMGDRAGLSRRL